ncbi:hypothetical protein [Streptomyces jumonjinensis]|uniref:hypothetical protein n=1 Tax=Streptomyces jumonjinensis TaxID=1945 RepID=UPI0037BA762C
MLTRHVVTFLGVCRLVLVAAVPSAVALTTPAAGDDGWVLWFFVPMNMGLHLTIASAFGSRQLGTLAFSWIAPLFTIGLTTLNGLALDQRWPADWPPPWLLWPTLFAFGLTALTFAWRFWFGQLQDTRRPATSQDPPG